MEKSKNKIIDLLPTGKTNAISQKQLSIILNVSERKLRKIIETERQNGQVICSSMDAEVNGYFLPATVEEAREFYATMKKRITTTLKCLRATRQWIKDASCK